MQPYCAPRLEQRPPRSRSTTRHPCSAHPSQGSNPQPEQPTWILDAALTLDTVLNARSQFAVCSIRSCSKPCPLLDKSQTNRTSRTGRLEPASGRFRGRSTAGDEFAPQAPLLVKGRLPLCALRQSSSSGSGGVAERSGNRPYCKQARTSGKRATPPRLSPPKRAALGMLPARSHQPSWVWPAALHQLQLAKRGSY